MEVYLYKTQTVCCYCLLIADKVISEFQKLYFDCFVYYYGGIIFIKTELGKAQSKRGCRIERPPAGQSAAARRFITLLDRA